MMEAPSQRRQALGNVITGLAMLCICLLAPAVSAWRRQHARSAAGGPLGQAAPSGRRRRCRLGFPRLPTAARAGCLQVRLFSVIKYESVIHEVRGWRNGWLLALTPLAAAVAAAFVNAAAHAPSLSFSLSPHPQFDPYFNYRVTRFLADKGFYETWDFFDSFTWYPLGRVVGGTMYPGARCGSWAAGSSSLMLCREAVVKKRAH